MPSQNRVESDEVFRFTARYLEDEGAGKKRTLEDYVALFPAFPELIRKTFAELEGEVTPQTTASSGADASVTREMIGPYRILRELGRGGQGMVVLAEDTRLRRNVALKLLKPLVAGSPAMRTRLAREAEAASKLDHPGICTVYEVGEADGHPYIAMRHVEGKPLSDVIAEARSATGEGDNRTPVALADMASDSAASDADAPSTSSGSTGRGNVFKVARFIERAARALHTAHEAGLIHRDVKPGNIMVTTEGEPVLLDFGLVRDEESTDHTLTRSDELLGTPAYMAPEQLTDSPGAVDRRADIYALGVTLYEALTLRRPFDAPTRDRLYHDILSTNPPPPQRLNPRIPRDLLVVLEVAMERDRNRRYQTALDLADDLARIRTFAPIHARPTPMLLRLKRWVQRNPAAATALFLVTVGLVVTALLLRQVSQEKEATRLLGLVAASEQATVKDPMLALLLAREAVRADATPETVSQLHRVLAEPLPSVLYRSSRLISWETGMFAASGGRIAALSFRSEEPPRFVNVWDPSGKEVITIETRKGILDFAISPEGDRIVILLDDGRLQFRNDDGNVIGTVAGVACFAALSALLLFQRDGSVSRHDWHGKKLGDLRSTPSVVTALDVDTAGEWVALGCKDGTLEVRDPNGVRLQRYRGPLNPEEVAYHAASKTIVALGTARVGKDEFATGVVMWARPNEDTRQLLPDGIRTLSFRLSPGGDRLLTVDGTDNAEQPETVVLHDFAGEVKRRIVRPAGHPGLWQHRWGGFAPDGKQFFTAYQDGTVALWDALGRHVRSIDSRGFEQIRACEYTPDGRYLLVAGFRDATRLFDREGRQVRTFRAPDRTLGTTFSPDGRHLLTLCGGGARLWPFTNARLPRYTEHRAPVAKLAVAPDGRVATGTDSEARCRIFAPPAEGSAPKKLKELGLDRGYSLGHVDVEFSPDGRFLLTGSMHDTDDVARLWDTGTWTKTELRGHTAPLWDVAFSEDGREVYTASSDGTARRWSLSGECLHVYDAGVRPEKSPRGNIGFVFCVTNAGEHVLTSHGDGAMRLWTRTGEKPIRTFRMPDLDAEHGAGLVRFLPGGDRFVSSDPDGRLRFWSIDETTPQKSIPNAAARPVIAVSPRGDRLAVAMADGTARILDLEGRILAELRGHDAPVQDVCFTPDGRQLLTASEDRTVRTWFVYTDDVLAHADERAIRSLTDEERQEYALVLGSAGLPSR